jgi:DNA repair exonuclease SbcCD ATPase subunit
MKLKLKNFRCYLEKEFDFGDSGITLISGISGVGKTTILLGIQFVLFGSGTKLVSYGKTSCSVELEFNDLKIIRTKRPNRLVVNDIYEDDAGQEIINNIFGLTFETTGYISQNGLNSFILMSPVEKLGFLEKFAFKDINLDDMKLRCKSYISKCNDEFISVTSQVELLKKILESQDKPKKIIFPIKCKKEHQEIIIKNENIGFKNAEILIKKSNKNLRLFENELSDLKVYLANISNKKENLNIILEKLSNLDKELRELNFDSSINIKEYELQLLNIVKYKELNDLEKGFKENVLKLEQIKREELDSYNEKLQKYKEEIWQDYKYDELIINIQDYRELLIKMKELNKYRKEIKKYEDIDDKLFENNKEKIEKNKLELINFEKIYDKLKSQENIYQCPSCSCNLRFVDDKLIESSEEIINEFNITTVKNMIDKLKKEINNLDKDIRNIEYNLKIKNNILKNISDISDNYEEMDIEEIENNIIDLEDYKKINKDKEEKVKELIYKIENNIFSSSYTSFNKMVLNDKKKIEELKKFCESYNNNIDENELRKIINNYKYNKDKYDRFELEKKNLLKEENKIREDIIILDKNYKTKYTDVKELSKIQKSISECIQDVETYELKRKNHCDNLNKIKDWEINNEKLLKYQELVDKVNNMEILEKEVSNKYSAAKLLKEKILEAESISLLNIIESINIHAQIYLEAFFIDNPINIRLLPFKETKKITKPQINLEIEYKSMECDFNSLSGGEQARVILAFTLALAEIFNTPLIMLDECVANLDQETTSIVFDGIREHYKGKLSLVIAHQVVMGHFDKIIQI